MEVSGGRMLEGIRMENSRDFSDLLQKNSSLKKIMNEKFPGQIEIRRWSVKRGSSNNIDWGNLEKHF